MIEKACINYPVNARVGSIHICKILYGIAKTLNENNYVYNYITDIRLKVLIQCLTICKLSTRQVQDI